MSQPTASGTAWRVVVLLMPVALLNYLDRQMLASMKASVLATIPTPGPVEQQDTHWGFMLGLFKWVYAVVSLFAGYVADRFGRRATVCGSLFVWSGITWWTGRVETYDELLWARSLMGFSEAFYIPAALALIADYHTGGTRSRAVGLHQMAIYCGVIAGGFAGYVAQTATVRVELVQTNGVVDEFAFGLGWRVAFTACGVFGMLYAVPLLVLLRDAPRTWEGEAPAEPGESNGSAGASPSQARPSPIDAVRSLVANTSFLLLVLYFTLPAMAGWVVRDWMPAILKEEFRISQGRAGVLATLPWQLAAIVGAAVGGFLADRWMRRSHRGRVFVSAIGMSLIVPAIFGMGNAGTVSLVVVFLVLFGLGWGFFDGNNMPILAQIVRPELRATGYGVMNFVSISVGGLADWGFGALRASKVPLNVSFGLFAALAVVSVVLVLLIRPKPELVAEK